MNPSLLTIGQLAAHAGVTVRAIRHYHASGLLPSRPGTPPATAVTTPRPSST